MKPIIEVNHVWKEYQKGIDRRYKSLRDSVSGLGSRLFGQEKEKFWALEDVDFTVQKGESVGIIGRNGAGKSTLLKILSRITPPTKGEVILRGRVASLLEVGTGFHPELTGRENIYFNGSILGMQYREIKSKFDEIVDFSGVESFIDTPLKHYSSGMQMRLAFSVAAHLDSEILLIDEVLAVGDADFQKKCIGKMDEVSKEDGKTILFVSHDLNALFSLTTRGLLLYLSKLVMDSDINSSVLKYNNLTDNLKSADFTFRNRTGNGMARIKTVNIQSTSSLQNGYITSLEDAVFSIEFDLNESTILNEFRLDLGINNMAGKRVAWMSFKKSNIHVSKSFKKIDFVVYKIPLQPGEYTINLYCEVNNHVADWLKNIALFRITTNNYFDPNLRIPEGQGDIILQYKVI